MTATITKVEDFKDIMAYRIMSTPALVINGDVKAAGRIPSVPEITTWLTTAAMAEEQASRSGHRGLSNGGANGSRGCRDLGRRTGRARFDG